jgi:hypothetical protein
VGHGVPPLSFSHGCCDHHLDPSSFCVEALNSTQYDALVTLKESYFAAGYEWFTPVALLAADQDNLAKRFAGRASYTRL